MDKSIKCVQCNQSFIFNEKEQQFFQDKGFVDPKRCLNCRRAKRASQLAPRMGDAPVNTRRY